MSFMPMENVRKVIAFLQASDYFVFRAIGGEPTMHPSFGQIINLALAEGLRIDLFSNATWKSQYNDLFSRISPSRLLFLLNIDHPDNYSRQLWARIQENLSCLSGRPGVSFSFNIFEKEPRYHYLLEMAQSYQVRAIRLSFSLPVIGVKNACLALEDYEAVAPFIVQFVRECEGIGVSVQLDNAVPPCIFTNEQAGELLLKRVWDLERNSACNPIVDIGPDLTTWYCFCLSKLFHRHLDDFESLEQARRFYRSVVHVYQHEIFPLEKCADCRYRELWGCQGGCLTFSIEEGRGGPSKTLQQALDQHDAARKRVLQLAENIQVKEYTVPTTTYVLTKTGDHAEMEISPAFKGLVDLMDGTMTVAEAIDSFVTDGAPLPDATPLDIFSRNVLAEGVDKLIRGLEQRGFLLSREDSMKSV